MSDHEGIQKNKRFLDENHISISRMTLHRNISTKASIVQAKSHAIQPLLLRNLRNPKGKPMNIVENEGNPKQNQWTPREYD